MSRLSFRIELWPILALSRLEFNEPAVSSAHNIERQVTPSLGLLESPNVSLKAVDTDWSLWTSCGQIGVVEAGA